MRAGTWFFENGMCWFKKEHAADVFCIPRLWKSSVHSQGCIMELFNNWLPSNVTMWLVLPVVAFWVGWFTSLTLFGLDNVFAPIEWLSREDTTNRAARGGTDNRLSLFQQLLSSNATWCCCCLYRAFFCLVIRIARIKHSAVKSCCRMRLFVYT